MKLAPAAMKSAAVGPSMIVPAPRITSGSSRLTRRARSANVAYANSPRLVNSTTRAPPSRQPATNANAASGSGATNVGTAPTSRIARSTSSRWCQGIVTSLLRCIGMPAGPSPAARTHSDRGDAARNHRARMPRAHNLRVDLPVNLVDLAVIAIAVVAAILGWRSGAIPQVLGLAGAAVGIAAVVLLVPSAAGALDRFDAPIRAFLAFGGAFLVVAVAEAIGSTLGAGLRDRLGRGVANRLDALLGAAFGIAQALVLAWLIGGLLVTGPFPTLARESQRSVAVRALLGVLPPPSEVAGELGSLIDASGLPQVFTGLEPVPAPPVPMPGLATAEQIAAPARESVVRVDAQACGQILTGTGFAVAPNFVVTNAHVVAGASSVAVTSDVTGHRHAGIVVLFDPELDLALVRTPDLVFRPLQLAGAAPARGTVGAALGHPNGGALTVVPAAVSAEIRARGRDLYATHIVIRDILELRAPVEPGDSGGPLVLADGTVGGVVFAESRTDASVGYALDPLAVADRVNPLLGRTAAVDTGACIR